MKITICIWLLITGFGCSYSVIRERKNRVLWMKNMESCLQRMANSVQLWNMTLEEAVDYVMRDETQMLYGFWSEIGDMISHRDQIDFSKAWQELSMQYLKGKVPPQVLELWCKTMDIIPMDVGELAYGLQRQANAIMEYRLEMQEKYREEQKLVLSMGIFTGAFLSLILW